MMLKALRTIGGIAAGIAVTIVLVIAVEFFSAIVHPFPEDLDKESFEELCQHVASYPHWVLAVVVLLWGATAFAGAWTAGRLGNRESAAILGLLLLSMVILNISMLPYPIWFEIASIVAIVATSAYAWRVSNRCASAVTRPDPEQGNSP